MKPEHTLIIAFRHASSCVDVQLGGASFICFHCKIHDYDRDRILPQIDTWSGPCNHQQPLSCRMLALIFGFRPTAAGERDDSDHTLEAASKPAGGPTLGESM
jgi:hypothetical protein